LDRIIFDPGTQEVLPPLLFSQSERSGLRSQEHVTQAIF